MISSFIPVVSGRRTIFAGSPPAITAAACMTKPPAEPLTTSPASAPHISANTLPAALFNSARLTMTVAVFRMASAASGLSFAPPHMVVVPDALIMRRTPSDRYISSPLNDKSIPDLETREIGGPGRAGNYITYCGYTLANLSKASCAPTCATYTSPCESIHIPCG